MANKKTCKYRSQSFQRAGKGMFATTLKKGTCKYYPTKKNRNTLKRYKRGESIGFTLTSSLKAKGMIPRTSKSQKGKRIVSEKYCSQ